MTLDEIKEVLSCVVISEHYDPSTEIKYAYASDLMSDVLVAPQPGALLISGLTNNHSVRTAKIAGVLAIVFVRGKEIEDETLEIAKRYQIPILHTKLTMFEACGILYTKGITGIRNENQITY
jgi:predicted transcriptional regulator